MRKSNLMGGASIASGARVFHANNPQPLKFILYKMPDGSLTFLNGSPVQAGQLVPGQNYEVKYHPSCFDEQGGLKK